ncbi:MAG TPA: SIS domain-containing protein [Chthonomonadaceae bacterium]|nr:SIS domain-containing protein [Chthonomonadaceae bacterium]
MTELLKDILREPEELAKSLAYTVGPGRAALQEAAQIVNAADLIYITGIGSSWHAGMAVLWLFQARGRPAVFVDASELLHFGALAPNAALILLSRSGKSVEVVGLIEKVKRAGTKLIAVTNTPESPLAQSADVTLRLEAAFDHNVSITMYSALTLVGGLLACAALGELDAGLTGALGMTLMDMPEVIAEWQSQIAESDWFASDAPTYFLARGGSLASAHEARLLWEEAAKAPASALTTGGFRHGPQEMLEPGTRIGLWLDAQRLRAQDLALAADLRAAGAKVMLIGQELPTGAGDLTFQLPFLPAAWQFLLDIVPAQLAAERLARLRGVDCDSFRLCPYIVDSEGGLGH